MTLCCPSCRFSLAHFTGQDLAPGVPGDGTVIICTRCATASIVEAGGALRLLTRDEVARLPPSVLAALAECVGIARQANVFRRAMNN